MTPSKKTMPASVEPEPSSKWMQRNFSTQAFSSSVIGAYPVIALM